MSLSIYLPAFVVRSLSMGKAMMLKRLSIFALTLAGCGTSMTQADATFTYELSGSDTGKTVKQFSIARFFVRIDDPAEAERYLLFQAGRFFPMYAVDEAESRYTLLTPPEKPWLGPNTRAKQMAQGNTGKKEDAQAARADVDEDSHQQASPAAQPEAAVAESEAPAAEASGSGASSPAASAQPGGRWPTVKLKASKKTRNVAGIRCRVVRELVDGEPVMEHCMANSAVLGVTTREVITLSRLFRMARKMELDWLGVGSKDEEFIAVQSRDLRDNRLLQLTSVSTKPLAAGYLRIPRTFKPVESEARSDSGTTSKVAD